jgi:hypothetical protein
MVSKEWCSKSDVVVPVGSSAAVREVCAMATI